MEHVTDKDWSISLNLMGFHHIDPKASKLPHWSYLNSSGKWKRHVKNGPVYNASALSNHSESLGCGAAVQPA